MIPASHLLLDSALGLQRPSIARRQASGGLRGGMITSGCFALGQRPGELSRPMRLPANFYNISRSTATAAARGTAFRRFRALYAALIKRISRHSDGVDLKSDDQATSWAHGIERSASSSSSLGR